MKHKNVLTLLSCALFALTLAFTPTAAYALSGSTAVYVSRTGTKYHLKSTCSNMRNPSTMTLSQAVAAGRTACAKCASGTVVTPDPTPTPSTYRGFSDVSTSHWVVTEGWIDYVLDEGLMKGSSDKFNPDGTLTRAEAAQILWNMTGKPSAASEPFNDVKTTDWFYEAISWARATGVVNGNADLNTFSPNSSVTRAEFCVMLSNYAKKITGVDVTSTCSKLDSMADASSVPSWARVQMGWALDKGIMGGVGGTQIQASANASRAAAAKMITVFHRDVLGL